MKIEKKIVAVSLADTAAVNAVPMDINPLHVRIDRRPEAPLDAVIEKITMSNGKGKRNLYIAVSFMEVDGVIDGKPITIMRPIEVFLPAGQSSEDYQWIVATMRSLSLAARGGYFARALQDLRKVPWEHGQVRCGEKDWGNEVVKPLYHPSEVAAIAYAIQRILERKGLVDADGNEVPARVLAGIEKAMTKVEKPAVSAGTCVQCGSNNIQKLDGCDTCLDCGYSKCG